MLGSGTVLWLCFFCLAVIGSSNRHVEAVDPLTSPVSMNVSISKTKMKLVWSMPSPAPTSFVVRYNNNTIENIRKNGIVLSNLLPYTNYTITVLACRDKCEPVIGPQVYRTKISSPGLVENVAMRKVNSTHVALRWDPPYVPDGLGILYLVRISDHNHTANISTSLTNIHMPRPSCADESDDSATQKVFINVVTFEKVVGKSGQKPKLYKGSASSPLIFYADCMRLATTVPKDESALSLYFDETSVSKTTINLEWSAPKKAPLPLYYSIAYNSSTTTANGTQVTLRNLRPNTAYLIKVSACVAAKNCQLSTAPVTVRTKLGIPDPVQDLRVERTDTGVLLATWRPTSADVGASLEYVILVDGAIFTRTDESQVEIPMAKCTDSRASNSNATVSVAAILPDSGNIMFGEFANATVFAECVVSQVRRSPQPTMDELSVGSASITMRWRSANASESTTYRVEVNETIITTDKERAYIPKLTPNSVYAVTAFECAANCTPFFGPTAVRTQPLIPIAVRRVSVVDANSTHFRVEWQPPARLQNVDLTYSGSVRVNDSDSEFQTTATYLEWSKHDCASATTNLSLIYPLTVTITVVNEADDVYAAEPTSFSWSLPCLKVLERPAFSKMISTDVSIDLEWTPVVREIRMYKITCRLEGSDALDQERVYESDVHRVTLTGLEPDCEYEVRVDTCDADLECQNYTEPVAVRTSVPAVVVVENATVEASNSTHAVVSWSAPSVLRGHRHNYTVELKCDNVSSLSTWTISTFVEVPIPDCPEATNDGCVLEISTTPTSRRAIRQPAAVPMYRRCDGDHNPAVWLTSVAANSSSIELTWTDSNVTEYVVTFDDDDDDGNVTVSEAAVSLTGLQPGHEYRLRILDDSSNPLVPSFSVRTAFEEVRVENVTVDRVDRVYDRISWRSSNDAANASTFKVEYAASGLDLRDSLVNRTFVEYARPRCRAAEAVRLDVTVRPVPCARDLVGVPTTATLLLPCAASGHLTELRVSEASVRLAWHVDASFDEDDLAEAFFVRYNESRVRVNGSRTEATVSDLLPDTAYTVHVMRCFSADAGDDDECDPVVRPFAVRTRAPAPFHGSTVRVHAVNATHANVSWTWSGAGQPDPSVVYDVRLRRADQSPSPASSSSWTAAPQATATIPLSGGGGVTAASEVYEMVVATPNATWTESTSSTLLLVTCAASNRLRDIVYASVASATFAFLLGLATYWCCCGSRKFAYKYDPQKHR